MTKQIQLTLEKISLVSDHRFEYLNQFTWHAEKNGNTYYAYSDNPKTYMHCLIMPVREGYEVDHKDGDGLNNQDENLREATRSQNIANSRMYASNSSGYRGVTPRPHRQKFDATIRVGQKQIFLGSFKLAEEAAKAYDAAAKIHFGEFASLNFPE